jgi:two-component system LytT family sensor kinase
MDKTEKRLCFYCSLLIAITLNSTKLLALRENGIMAHYWHFNLYEFSFQLLYSFCFTCLFLYGNVYYKLWLPVNRSKYLFYGVAYMAVIFAAMVIGGAIQRNFFSDKLQQQDLYWSGYFSRFMIGAALSGIVIKIMLLMRESREKTRENAQLKTAYLQAELELLKGQLDPHFLFNSLSSLSGIIREDPVLAQHYVGQLSKVFRHSLQRSGNNLVTVADELAIAKAYGELLTMRFEKAFQLDINISDEYLGAMIPHLSIQLLLENAAKHNIATLKKPLIVSIYVENGCLVVSNNLQELKIPENSPGIGLANLNGRCKILMGKEVDIVKSTGTFTVKLPLN